MDIKLTFLGAAQNVTGSRYLVEVNNTRVLVDCGMHQERHLRSRDWEPFPISPRNIDAVLLTHAHIDHCGYLPKLVREGFHRRIYCTRATADIARIALLDAAQMQVEDASFKRRRHERERRKARFPELPLYTPEDVKAVFPLFSPVRYKSTVEIGNHLEATLYEAGHVLGSAMVLLKVRQGHQERSVLFSGDLGRKDKPIVRDPTVLHRADYIVIESTYGDRTLDPPATAAAQLARVINDTARAGGNVVIPAFAIERSQELLYYLNDFLNKDLIPHLLVFVDSPMAAEVTGVFTRHPELYDEEMNGLVENGKSPFEFPGLHLVKTTGDSKAINHIKGTVIIMAGSGMCTGGRIKHHLVTNISRAESTILFTGYQAVGTLGRQIVDGAPRVRILGQEYPVKARIARTSGFSAHADSGELLQWLSAFQDPPRQLMVTHGEAAAAEHLAAMVREKMGWQVTAPAYLDSMSLS